MEMKVKMKNRSHRYGINRPRHGQNYIKYQLSLYDEYDEAYSLVSNRRGDWNSKGVGKNLKN